MTDRVPDAIVEDERVVEIAVERHDDAIRSRVLNLPRKLRRVYLHGPRRCLRNHFHGSTLPSDASGVNRQGESRPTSIAAVGDPGEASAKPYQLVLIDPPWEYYGSRAKDGAAGKHYPLMRLADLCQLPVPKLLALNAVVLLWATGPRLHLAVRLLDAWQLHYRGVLYVWVKTTKAGKIIAGQGVPPTFTKPTTEFVLAATTKPKGRPLPLRTFRQSQVVLAPRGKHSQKPAAVYALIDELFGPNIRKLELFARTQEPGWTALGQAVDGKDIAQSLQDLLRTNNN